MKMDTNQWLKVLQKNIKKSNIYIYINIYSCNYQDTNIFTDLVEGEDNLEAHT